MVKEIFYDNLKVISGVHVTWITLYMCILSRIIFIRKNQCINFSVLIRLEWNEKIFICFFCYTPEILNSSWKCKRKDKKRVA